LTQNSYFSMGIKYKKNESLIMKFTFEDESKNLPRREREKAKHRQEIFNAAIKVFAEKGFHKATLEEVAKEAEFSKGAIYNYFSNKENLLFEIMEHMLIFTRKLLQESLSGQKTFKEELTDLLFSATNIVYKNSDICELLIHQHAERFKNLSDETKQKLNQIHNDYHKILNGRIQKAIDTGEIKEIEPEIIAEVVTGALSSIMSFRWHNKTLENITKNCKIFVELLFDGIAKDI